MPIPRCRVGSQRRERRRKRRRMPRVKSRPTPRPFNKDSSHHVPTKGVWVVPMEPFSHASVCNSSSINSWLCNTPPVPVAIMPARTLQAMNNEVPANIRKVHLPTVVTRTCTRPNTITARTSKDRGRRRVGDIMVYPTTIALTFLRSTQAWLRATK